MIIEGVVCSGFGSASKFLRMDEYKEKIREVVGFEPYPGTLNLKVSTKTTEQIFKKAYKVEGFCKNSKKFGGFAIIPCKIKAEGKTIDGAVIFPERSKHKAVLEIISPLPLRKVLKLTDGRKVMIEIEV